MVTRKLKRVPLFAKKRRHLQYIENQRGYTFFNEAFLKVLNQNTVLQKMDKVYDVPEYNGREVVFFQHQPLPWAAPSTPGTLINCKRDKDVVRGEL